MFEVEKQKIIKYSIKMIDKGLTRSTGGNVSLFMREKKVMLITPSSIEYDEIKIEDIVEMDLDGNILSGIKKPSSEWRMHAIVYKKRKDINAFIHAHSVFSMAVSTLGKSLPAIDYMVAFSGTDHVPLAKYASYGTDQIAKNSYRHLKNYNAVLLENHGINTIAPNLKRCFAILENLELCAETYWRAKTIGNPRIIPKDEMMKMVSLFDKYGV